MELDASWAAATGKDQAPRRVLSSMDVQGWEWWTWLLVGLVLIGAEVVTPGGLILLFFGLAALVVGMLRTAGLLPAMWLQLLSFALLSVVALGLFRRPLLARLNLSGSGRDDVDSLVGETAVLLDDLAVDGLGKVELRGATWNARNAGVRAMARGERCTVARVDGLTLVVRESRAGTMPTVEPGAAHAKSIAIKHT